MGVIKQGILGGFSGKVANVVGSSWKGIAVIKSLPLSVANPQTAGQVAQRTAFTAAVALAVNILTTLVKPLWDRFAQLQSGYNAFIQANISHFDGSGDLTYPDLHISSGSLLGDPIDSVGGANGSSNVVVAWSDNSGTGNALATDECYLLVLNETTGGYGVSSAVSTRTTEAATAVMSEDCTTGDTLHAYLAFRKADGTLVSPTTYDTDTV